MKSVPTTDDYIAAAPEDVRPILERIRAIIRKAAPRAEERVGYGIPSFSLNGRPLMYYAAFKDHVSVYPVPRGTAEFQKELRPYVKGKGTIRFPLGRPVPFGLVKRIADFHVKERTAER